jgi:hypothetical protein
MVRVALALLAGAAAAADYSHDLAKRMVQYSGATYCMTLLSQKTIDDWSCAPCQAVPGFQQISQIRSSSFTGANAIVGFDPELKSRIVAFMGTNAQLDTILADVLLVPSSCYGDLGCSGCNCHPGFKRAFDSIKDEIYAAVSALPEGPIIVTGHSLGGAQAMHCAIDLHHRGLTPQHVYTMGQPRVGNEDLSHWYDALGIDNWRVTHHRDPIPHLPWRGLGNYHQVLREAYYEDANADAPTKLCDPVNSEDSTCADQFNDELTTLFITDHWSYLGFSFAEGVIRCTLADEPVEV